MILRPHRANIDEVLAIQLAPLLPNNQPDIRLARAIVSAVLTHSLYSELPYTKDGMPTNETAEILRFNRRLIDIVDEAI